MKKIILTFFSFIVWLLLTWNFDSQNLIVGGMVSVAVGLVFGTLFVSDAGKVFHPRRWFWFFIYIPKFLWEMTKANFDVAYRVLHPKMPINPGIVKVKTNIKSEMGIVFLANSITLTPGTLTIDLKGQDLYIHCINIKYKDVEKASKDIVERFEKLLIKIFD